MNKIAVIGLGLIGGSLALELKKSTWATVYGLDKNSAHLEKALELGIIYKKIDWDRIHEMDVVIIAVPVNIIPELSVKVLDLIGEKTLWRFIRLQEPSFQVLKLPSMIYSQTRSI